MNKLPSITSTLNMQCGKTVFQIPSVTHSEPQPIGFNNNYTVMHRHAL